MNRAHSIGRGKMTYNSELAAMHYKKNRELRTKANKKSEIIWTYGDGWAMVVIQL